MLFGPFVANAGFDQYSFFASVDEHAVHVHPNAVLFVGGTELRPQVARYDAEHRTTVEPKLTVRHNFDAIVAKLHRTKINALQVSSCLSAQASLPVELAARTEDPAASAAGAASARQSFPR